MISCKKRREKKRKTSSHPLNGVKSQLKMGEHRRNENCFPIGFRISFAKSLPPKFKQGRRHNNTNKIKQINKQSQALSVLEFFWLNGSQWIVPLWGVSVSDDTFCVISNVFLSLHELYDILILNQHFLIFSNKPGPKCLAKCWKLTKNLQMWRHLLPTSSIHIEKLLTWRLKLCKFCYLVNIRNPDFQLPPTLHNRDTLSVDAQRHAK